MNGTKVVRLKIMFLPDNVTRDTLKNYLNQYCLIRHLTLYKDKKFAFVVVDENQAETLMSTTLNLENSKLKVLPLNVDRNKILRIYDDAFEAYRIYKEAEKIADEKFGFYNRTNLFDKKE